MAGAGPVRLVVATSTRREVLQGAHACVVTFVSIWIELSPAWQALRLPPSAERRSADSASIAGSVVPDSRALSASSRTWSAPRRRERPGSTRLRCTQLSGPVKNGVPPPPGPEWGDDSVPSISPPAWPPRRVWHRRCPWGRRVGLRPARYLGDRVAGDQKGCSMDRSCLPPGKSIKRHGVAARLLAYLATASYSSHVTRARRYTTAPHGDRPKERGGAAG